MTKIKARNPEGVEANTSGDRRISTLRRSFGKTATLDLIDKTCGAPEPLNKGESAPSLRTRETD